MRIICFIMGHLPEYEQTGNAEYCHHCGCEMSVYGRRVENLPYSLNLAVQMQTVKWHWYWWKHDFKRWINSKNPWHKDDIPF